VGYVITQRGSPYYHALLGRPRFRLLGSSETFSAVFEYLDALPAYRWDHGTVACTRWTAERREFRLDSTTGGDFVLLEQSYPGWRAYVDGRQIPIRPYSDAFQQVSVPAGPHSLRFEYRRRRHLAGILSPAVVRLSREAAAGEAERQGRNAARYDGGLIKAVFFDLGQVLIPFRLERGLAALAARCGCPLEQVAARAMGSDLPLRFEEGLLEPDDFFRRFSALLGLAVDYPEFCDLYSSIFLPETIIPESMLAGLRRNYRLLLLSNTNAIHFAMVREHYPLLRHFHDYVLSYQVGVLKPAPEIYQAALACAGCLPRECFYTDDIAEYVEAARRQGLDAVQFYSLAQLKEELGKRGVGWQGAK
jgi:putative hydrolase of the HAD superfamily